MSDKAQTVTRTGRYAGNAPGKVEGEGGSSVGNGVGRLMYEHLSSHHRTLGRHGADAGRAR